MKLVTADNKKTVIAEFHLPHYFINRQRARLEVKPEGMGMLDYIIVTFVFVEQTRGPIWQYGLRGVFEVFQVILCFNRAALIRRS